MNLGIMYLAEVFWPGQKNPLPYAKVPLFQRGGERKIEEKDSDAHGKSLGYRCLAIIFRSKPSLRSRMS
jgi:hypothetical protein